MYRPPQESREFTSTFVSVIGCSGETVDQWSYDAPADEVTVDVREDPVNPDVRNVTFTATFGVTDVWDADGNLVHMGGTTVNGAFTATINR